MNRVDEHREAHALPDPREAIGTLSEQRVRALARVRGGEIELYRRTVVTLSMQLAGDAIRCRRGSDEGTALRWFIDGGVAFVAATGGGGATIDGLVEHLRQTARAPAAAPPSDAVELLDHDPCDPLPPVGELLAEARRRVRDGDGVRSLTLEVAQTLETCVGPAGSSSRLRERVAATAQLAGPVRRTAARGWAEFRARSWEPRAEKEHEKCLPALRGRWIVAGEAAAVLAGTLALRLHGPDARPTDVGPGWVLRDDPAAAGSLLGGSFDDTCRPSPSETLADGARAMPGTGEAGRLRRPSFRDPPVFMRTGLTIASSGEPDPEVCGTIDGVTVHPLEPERWLLVASGREGGGAPFRDATLETTPGRLARACAAAAGPAADYWNGVRTPSLVFEL